MQFAPVIGTFFSRDGYICRLKKIQMIEDHTFYTVKWKSGRESEYNESYFFTFEPAFHFPRYKKNLFYSREYVYSYETKVGKIENNYLYIGKRISAITTKHLNYAAKELNLAIIFDPEF